MAVVAAMIIGGILGSVAGLAATIVFPPEAEPAAAKPETAGVTPTAEPAAKPDKDRSTLVLSKSAGPTTVSMSPLIPDPNRKPASPNDLDLYFFVLTSAAFGDNIQYAEATVTNRSPRKMHLELWGHVDYWKDIGEPARYGMRAEWNPEDLKEGTGQVFIDLDEWETKKGRLVFFLGKPEENGLSKWFLNASSNVYIELFDTVTGKRSAFKPSDGYPAGQMPAPLPPRQKLLALNFPRATAPDSQSLPPLETLDLVARTHVFGYTDDGLTLEALASNLSENRLELKINFLVLNASQWRAFGGDFVPKDKASPRTSTLTLEPGKSAEGNLTFDLSEIGVSNHENPLSFLPKENLLEISDQVSGKKVWCAVDPGYPPGTDMRSFTIQPPSENPQANSSNPPPDESKDTK
jgi:hypothetical protein